jgi:hypothetical protein
VCSLSSENISAKLLVNSDCSLSSLPRIFHDTDHYKILIAIRLQYWARREATGPRAQPSEARWARILTAKCEPRGNVDFKEGGEDHKPQ